MSSLLACSLSLSPATRPILTLKRTVISTNVLEKYESLRFGELKGLNARKVLLIMGVMTLHSLAEGVGMGMRFVQTSPSLSLSLFCMCSCMLSATRGCSFGGGEVLGLFINIAIAIHNIPEGLAIALVMVPRGVSPLHASLWGAFSRYRSCHSFTSLPHTHSLGNAVCRNR